MPEMEAVARSHLVNHLWQVGEIFERMIKRHGKRGAMRFDGLTSTIERLAFGSFDVHFDEVDL